jgi:hypothetical protein
VPRHQRLPSRAPKASACPTDPRVVTPPRVRQRRVRAAPPETARPGSSRCAVLTGPPRTQPRSPCSDLKRYQGSGRSLPETGTDAGGGRWPALRASPESRGPRRPALRCSDHPACPCDSGARAEGSVSRPYGTRSRTRTRASPTPRGLDALGPGGLESPGRGGVRGAGGPGRAVHPTTVWYADTVLASASLTVESLEELEKGRGFAVPIVTDAKAPVTLPSTGPGPRRSDERKPAREHAPRALHPPRSARTIPMPTTLASTRSTAVTRPRHAGPRGLYKEA